MARLASGTAFFLVTALALSSVESRQLRSSDSQPHDALPVQAVAHMAVLLRQRTGGRIKISAGHSDRHSESAIVEQVRTGLLDMARVDLAALHSVVPATTVLSLPFLFTSRAHLRRVLDGPIGKEILAAFDDQGFIGLCYYDNGPRSFYSTRGPIRRAEDLKGMWVRVQPSHVTVKMVEVLGTTAVPIPFGQVARALKTHSVEAADSSWAGYITAGHYRVARYFSPTEHTMTPGVVVFSRKVWDELAPADRAALREAARDSVSFLRSRLDGFDETARLKAERWGVKVTGQIDRKSFTDLMLPAYPAMLPDARLQEMVTRIRAESEGGQAP